MSSTRKFGVEMKINIKEEQWIEWLSLKGLSERTIQNYYSYFVKLDLSNISNVYLLKFIKRYNNPVARAMLKNLFQYIKTNDFPKEVKTFLMDFEIPKITGRKKQRIPDVINKTQVHIIAKAMHNKRDSYMVLTTFYLGLRLSELLNLKIDNFNWDDWKENPKKAGLVKFIGKGNKERILPVVPQLMVRLHNWVGEELQKNPDMIKLFSISKRRWQKILSKVSKKVIGKSINPHLLRHSCGTYLFNQGLREKEIAEFLGHTSVVTTQIYLHINKSKLSSKIINAFG